MSEVLTSLQVRFPVGDCAFQFRLSAEVKNSVLAEFSTSTHRERERKSRPGDQSNSEICKQRSDRSSEHTH